jgi:hypothetical protein
MAASRLQTALRRQGLCKQLSSPLQLLQAFSAEGFPPTASSLSPTTTTFPTDPFEYSRNDMDPGAGRPMFNTAVRSDIWASIAVPRAKYA